MGALPTNKSASRLAQVLVVLAMFSLAASAGLDRATGSRKVVFQQLGLELQELDQLEELLEQWSRSTVAVERDALSARVAMKTRRILKASPQAARVDRLTRIETLIQWSQSLRDSDEVAENVAKLAELSQTQHRLRFELQSTVSRFESMQASAGAEASFYERGGHVLLGFGTLTAITAAVMLWRGRRTKDPVPRYASCHGPKGSRWSAQASGPSANSESVSRQRSSTRSISLLSMSAPMKTISCMRSPNSGCQSFPRTWRVDSS